MRGCAIVARGARPRRARPGGPRRAVQPRRPRARPAASARAGCRPVYAIASRRAGPFPARIRDVGVTVDLATHDVDILSWIAGERPTRVYAETAQRIHADHEDLLFGLLHFPSGCHRDARRQLADAGQATPARRRRRGGDVRARLPDPAPDLHQGDRHDQPAPDRRLRADLRGRGGRASGRLRRAARGGAGRVPRDRQERRPADRRRRGRPVGRCRGHVPARSRRRVATRSICPRCPRGSPSHDDRRRDRRAVPSPSSGARSSCRSTRAATSQAVEVSPWTGEPGTAGRVAVVGAGKMGLPLAAQFAGHGWRVIAVDVQQAVVDAINEGRSHVEEEPGLAELVRAAHDRGPTPSHDRWRRRSPSRPTSSCSSCRSCSTTSSSPTIATWTRRSTPIAPGVHAGSLVIFETTLPVGDTRERFTPRLEAASGLKADEDFFVAFSPERLYSGAALRNLATYPKLVGGIGPASTARAAAFYDAVLDTEIVAMSQRRGGRVQQARRHDLSRRQHRPRQRVRPLRRTDRRRHPRGDRRGEQPALLPHPSARPRGRRALHPGLSALPPVARAGARARGAVASNERRPGRRRDQGPSSRSSAACEGVPILVLGLTYRHGVNELAYSRALPLIERLIHQGAVVSAFDPLLDAEEIERIGAVAVALGRAGSVPGDRHPDGGSALRDARPGPGSRNSRSCSTAATASETSSCQTASPTAGSACPDGPPPLLRPRADRSCTALRAPPQRTPRTRLTRCESSASSGRAPS